MRAECRTKKTLGEPDAGNPQVRFDEGALETGPRSGLNGHEAGNGGYSQGPAYGIPRQRPTPPEKWLKWGVFGPVSQQGLDVLRGLKRSRRDGEICFSPSRHDGSLLRNTLQKGPFQAFSVTASRQRPSDVTLWRNPRTSSRRPRRSEWPEAISAGRRDCFSPSRHDGSFAMTERACQAKESRRG